MVAKVEARTFTLSPERLSVFSRLTTSGFMSTRELGAADSPMLPGSTGLIEQAYGTLRKQRDWVPANDIGKREHVRYIAVVTWQTGLNPYRRRHRR
ncbi:hypothetical protein ABZ883_36815 [Streptomyces sp. NPDC046977]|uniref:hypothetical protein n=1 Tax=Streptomyces sp. NPDC046977 TaxID=3154703 RepID=UPI0033FEA21B